MRDSIEAAYRLGRLDSEVAQLDETARRIFSALLVSRMIRTALEVEGHYTTLPRYQAWFAGVTTLNDEHVTGLRSARSITLAVLGALMGSVYHPLRTATEMMSAVFAGVDNGDAALEAASDEIVQASKLAGETPLPYPGPGAVLDGISLLAQRATESELFATMDREQLTVDIGVRKVAIEMQRRPSPRWALDLAAGHVMAKLRPGAPPLPCPGLFELGLLRPHLGGTKETAEALRSISRCIDQLLSCIQEARIIVAAVAIAKEITRTNSRLPAVIELVGSLGSLRSTQVERLLSMTDLGLRKTVDVGRKAEMLAVTRLAGVRMISLRYVRDQHFREEWKAPSPMFASETALHDLDEAERAVDALLARSKG